MKQNNYMSRRRFIAGSTAAIGLSMLNSKVFAAGRSSKVNIGIIGCGDRGTWIADLFLKHPGFRLVGVADYFGDRVENIGDMYNIPGNRRFTKLSGYKRLLDLNDVDAAVIISPPYFHPQQASDAVDAGKHVYLAKPVAVDVPGCKSIQQSAQKATDKDKVFLVDFQTRANRHFIEAVKRVHAGAIGEVVFGETICHTGPLPVKEQSGTAEARLRNWVFDKALSGDIITEQNIHNIDVMNWIMDDDPVCASGTGGKKTRLEVGDCFDNFAVLYEYKNNVGVTFSSHQIDGHGSRPSGFRNRMYGTEGVIETEYGGKVLLRCKKLYRGTTPTIYQQGAQTNIAAFHRNIAREKYDNTTVKPSVTSNLVTILGRTAAYQNQKVTWNDLLKTTEQFDGKLQGLKT